MEFIKVGNNYIFLYITIFIKVSNNYIFLYITIFIKVGNTYIFLYITIFIKVGDNEKVFVDFSKKIFLSLIEKKRLKRTEPV